MSRSTHFNAPDPWGYGPDESRSSGGQEETADANMSVANPPSTDEQASIFDMAPIRPPKRKFTEKEQDVFTARHPKVTDAKWYKMATDEHGNLVVKDKKSDKTYKNSYMVQQPSNTLPNEVWGGSFTHTQGSRQMYEMWHKTNAEDTPHTLLLMTHTRREIAEQEAIDAGQHPSVPLVPFAGSASSVNLAPKRQLARDQIPCANCKKVCHLLKDCVGPYSRSGDIPGCPVCNTMEHGMDQCPNASELSKESVFTLLVANRGNKCLIRSDVEVYQLAVELDKKSNGKLSSDNIALPWTRRTAIAVKVLEKNEKCLQTWDYKNRKGGPAPDPTISWPSMLAGDVPSSSYSAYIAARKKAKDEAATPTRLPERSKPAVNEDGIPMPPRQNP
ncbi:hypothetical protein DL767_011449 [Monosporascus sp. MG133]|nr:hypothetical protein DL767_011449 [Monosporascus sp. MG133]